MFLCKRITDYRQMTAIGQMLMVSGLLLMNLDRIFGLQMADFVQGFTHGLGFTLLMASIVFNIRGLIMYRQQKQ